MANITQTISGTSAFYGTASWAEIAGTSTTATNVGISTSGDTNYYNITFVSESSGTDSIKVDDGRAFIYYPQPGLMIVPTITTSFLRVTGDISGSNVYAARVLQGGNSAYGFITTGTNNSIGKIVWYDTASSAMFQIFDNDALSLYYHRGFPMVFYTNATERMRISGTGADVGIGTNVVNGTARFIVYGGNNAGMRLHSTSSAGYFSGTEYYSGSTQMAYIGMPDGGAAIASRELLLFTNSTNNITFYTNGVRRMTITGSDGTIHMGSSTSPELVGAVHITASGNPLIISLDHRLTAAQVNQTFNSYGGLVIGGNETAKWYSFDMVSGRRIINSLQNAFVFHQGGAAFTGLGMSGSAGAGIYAIADNSNTTVLDRGMHLTFHTLYSGQASSVLLASNERMRVTNSGSVGIGVTNPGNKLSVSELSGVSSNFPTTLGRTSGSFGVYASAQAYGMMFGVDGTGDGWVQVGRGDLTATAYDLIFQPIGGSVGIATTNPGKTLHVQGEVSASIYNSSIRNTAGFAGTASWALNAVSAPTSGDLTGSLSGSIIGRVGVGSWKFNPLAGLQINPKVVDDDGYAYSTASIMVVHPKPTGTTGLNDPQEVLYLARQGTSAQAYGAAAAFAISRYENVSVNSRTQLDIKLAHATFLQSAPSVMTLKSNGDVTVTGHFMAVSKAFKIPHPTKDGMTLQYGSLESPYHGVRLTGEVEGAISESVISLPDYMHSLVRESGANVQLTPKGSFASLCVNGIDIPNNKFYVGVQPGQTASFYWSFTAIRKDVPMLEVES